jgi:multidrug efflux pump subunit AcrB
MSEHQDTPMNVAGKLARAFLTSKITALMILAVSLTGMLALLVTPREYNPQIVVPAANIIVAKPGASATEIRNLVVKPLEAIMNAQSGVDHTYGYASNDFGVVTVQFKVGENQEDSLVKMYNQLMQNIDRIPPGAMEPLVKPINVDDVPILTLTLASQRMTTSVAGGRPAPAGTGAQRPRRVLHADRRRPPAQRQRLARRQRLDAPGLSLDKVDMMLRGSNVAAPLGELVQDNQATPLRLQGFLGSAEEVGKIVVGVSRQGRPVYLKDIARVEDGAAEIEETSRFAYGPAAASAGLKVNSPP